MQLKAPLGIDDLTDVDTPTPVKNQCLKFNGSLWVPAAYDYSFTFSIATFSHDAGTSTSLIGASTSAWKVIGALIFLATYNNPHADPTPYVVISGAGNSPANINMTPAAPDANRYKGPTTNPEAINWPSANGSRITFILYAQAGAETSNYTVYSGYFYNHFVYADLDHNNGFNDADIDGMAAANEIISSTTARTFTLTIGVANYLCFSHRTGDTAVAQVRCGTGNDVITVAMNKNDATAVTPLKETVSHSNANGKVENFYVYASKLQNLSSLLSTSFTTLASSTPQNYLYWGELNKASGYTESDVENNYATQPGKLASNTMSSRSMTVNCTASEYTYIAYPARLGALTSIMIGGFESLGDFNVDNTALAITNVCGFQENYRVYVSKNPGFTDPTTMLVTI